jgi:hypothetical protein
MSQMEGTGPRASGAYDGQMQGEAVRAWRAPAQPDANGLYKRRIPSPSLNCIVLLTVVRVPDCRRPTA